MNHVRLLLVALNMLVGVTALQAGEPSPDAALPPGIADPDKAITDPMFNDPVLFWRVISAPKNIYEPEPYFYWPVGVVAGAPRPLPAIKPNGPTTIPKAALDDIAKWAEAQDSNALVVIHKGVVQMERYWKGTKATDLANGRAISRSVTPMLLGFAIADGKASLDDPIGRFITEWKDDPRGRITVRQLAQNVSGLEVAPSLPVTQVLGNKDLCLTYCGDVVRAALNYDYVMPPGQRFESAQENMQLLALVVERAMGMPIQTLLSERVWKPIGAADAAVQLDRPGGSARMMCCMRATPVDWARLGLLVMQNGKWEGRQVLPKGWVDTMATPSERNRNFGLGLWLGSPFVAKRTYFENQPGVIPQSEPFLVDDVRIMEGGGFRTVFMVPSQQLVIHRHGPASPGWDHAYLVNTILRGMARK